MPLEFDDGTTANIVPVHAMKDDQIEAFETAQTKLVAVDEEDDYVAVKSAMVELLAVCSDSPDAVRKNLAGESLGVLKLIYEDYTGSLTDATKSTNDPGVPSGK